MNTSWHSYPKVWALGHAAIKELFLDDVLVEEKVDGSQISFGRFDGELKIRSKGQELVVDYPEKMFALGVGVIKKLDLKDGWTYRGEYLQKPKHNVLAYFRVPKQHIILYDINTGEEDYVSYDEKAQEAERIGLEVVPLLHHGKIFAADELTEFLETVSILGGTPIEGMVIKNYARFTPDKKAMMGKYVSERFKERHANDWKRANPTGKDVAQGIIESLRTEARWGKAVQHIKEDGLHEGSPRDIGNLMKALHQDIEDEETDYIKDTLYSHYIKQIKRGVAGGLPEWYKEKLMKSQFGSTEEDK